MRSTLLMVVVAFCFSVRGQDRDVVLSDLLNKMELLSEQFQEMQQELGIVKDQVTEMSQGSVNQEHLLKVFQGLLEMEVGRGNEIANKTCKSDQLESLNDTFSTELQSLDHALSQSASEMQVMNIKAALEGKISRFEASSEVKISNLKNVLESRITSSQTALEEKFSTHLNKLESKITNLQHSSADKMTSLQNLFKSEVNNMKMSLQRCSSKEELSSIGNQIMRGLHCSPPSLLIPELGCITPVSEEMTWSQAQQNCNNKGSRLLEGITSQRHLNLLKESFLYLFPKYGDAWLGFRGLRWVEGQGHISRSSRLWNAGQPDTDHECGATWMSLPRPAIHDAPCTWTRHSLCQRR